MLPLHILGNGYQWIAAFERGADGRDEVVEALGMGHLAQYREHVGTQMVAAARRCDFNVQCTHEGANSAIGSFTPVRN